MDPNNIKPEPGTIEEAAMLVAGMEHVNPNRQEGMTRNPKAEADHSF